MNKKDILLDIILLDEKKSMFLTPIPLYTPSTNRVVRVVRMG
jgi:hypothetical protein